MHDFKYKNNELYCENVKVSTIASKVDTPCISTVTTRLSIILQNYKKLLLNLIPLFVLL